MKRSQWGGGVKRPGLKKMTWGVFNHKTRLKPKAETNNYALVINKGPRGLNGKGGSK